MKDIKQRLHEHPELGITPETVNGRQMYRHRTEPGTRGVWISRDKVRQIADKIPENVVVGYKAECVVNVIQEFDLGEYGLKAAQKNHYNILMENPDACCLLPQYAARKAAEVAKKYGLGYEAIRAAREAVYDSLMGDRHQRLPHAAIREAIGAALEFDLDDRHILEAAERLAKLQE